MTTRQTFSILFYLRKDKENKDGEVPIYLRITVNGKRSEMATNRYILTERWNYEAGRPKGTKEDVREINEYMDLLRRKVYDSQKKLLEEDKEVTAVSLRNMTQGNTGIRKTVGDVFQYHNSMMEELIPSQYAPATLVRFKTTYDHIKAFMIHDYGTDDMFLSQLNHEFITRLEHYFMSVKKCNHNTAAKYIKNFRKVINLAVKNDWAIKDPFAKYSIKIKEVKREFLDADELETIENLKIQIQRLDLVRDIFVFSCYTGMSYVDVAALTPENIRKGIDGDQWIFTERTKTSIKSNVPLLPKALEIIEKYKNYPTNNINNVLLPVLSNQKMNAYLKEIADLAGVSKNITFHLARHTFATTVTMTNGVPLESISEMMGHKSTRTTQMYAKILDKKVSEDMKILKSKIDIDNNKKIAKQTL